MKLREIIQQLQSEGHQITFKNRIDTKGRLRGIRITSIDGTKYSASTGNIVARQMLNVDLSLKQSQQLETIIRRVKPLPEDIQKQIRRVQRLSRKRIKAGEEKVPKLKTKNIRYTIQKYGEEEARKQIKDFERKVKKLVPTWLWDEYTARVIYDVKEYANIFGSNSIIFDWQNMTLSANINKIDYYNIYEPLIELSYNIELAMQMREKEVADEGIYKSLELLGKVQ